MSASTLSLLRLPARVAEASPVLAEPVQDRIVAIIGTAGRDKSIPMTQALWQAMCRDMRTRVHATDHLVSGGAAWADHLAVHAYLEGWVRALTLYLPAPLGEREFLGPHRSAASAANYYHANFRVRARVDAYAQIVKAIQRGAKYECEMIEQSYRPMFARNKKVAGLANAVIAYTFGEKDVPADGGTMDTWKQIDSSDKVHVPLRGLTSRPELKPETLAPQSIGPDSRELATVGSEESESCAIAHPAPRYRFGAR